MNAASLGCFLLAPEANLSWTEAQLFCERVSQSFPKLVQISITLSCNMSATFPTRKEATSQSFTQCNRSKIYYTEKVYEDLHQWRFQQRTFFRLPSLALLMINVDFILQASLVSSLAHLMLATSTIKHWYSNANQTWNTYYIRYKGTQNVLLGDRTHIT